MSALIGVKALPENGFLLLLRQSISAHGIFLLPISLYCVAYELLHQMRSDMGPAHLAEGVLTAAILFIPLFFMGQLYLRFYHITRYVKPASPLRALIQDEKQFLTDPARLAHGLPALLIIAIIGFIFSDIQNNTLALNPNTWDAYFSNLDKTIHFGRQPWEILQPLLGYGPITFLINLNYNMWFFTMIALLIHFGFASQSSETRTRFLLSYIAVWIIAGNVLAVIFSSGGPCYFTRMGLSPDPYLGLMTYLRTVNESIPVWAVGFQDVLWQGHLQKSDMAEISAMPSLHNAAAMLFALMGFQISRFWGRILTVQAFLIFIGSIHLAWHYAVDSYLAWIVTLVIWLATAPIARWWHSTHAQKEFDRMIGTTG